MRMITRNELLPSIEKASKAYDEAGFTDEKKFVFLSKGAMQTYESMQITLLHVLKTFIALKERLNDYDESLGRFARSNTSKRSLKAQDVRRADKAQTTKAPTRPTWSQL